MRAKVVAVADGNLGGWSSGGALVVDGGEYGRIHSCRQTYCICRDKGKKKKQGYSALILASGSLSKWCNKNTGVNNFEVSENWGF